MDVVRMPEAPRWGDPPGAPSTPASTDEAICLVCQGPMTDLEISPRGGPWTCLTCRGVTLEEAREQRAAGITASWFWGPDGTSHRGRRRGSR
jgi:hypothetical protein